MICKHKKIILENIIRLTPGPNKLVYRCSDCGLYVYLDETEEIRGAEGIRINEFMAKPTAELAVSAEQSPGGDWQWKDGYYENPVSAGGIEGEGSWIWQNIPSGEYYLTVFAASEDQIVGDVLADGVTQENMRSGERFTKHETVTVSGGKFRLDIRNNLSEGSCFFKSALLSQQPDAEYIELVNLTADEVSALIAESVNDCNSSLARASFWPISSCIPTAMRRLSCSSANASSEVSVLS